MPLQICDVGHHYFRPLTIPKRSAGERGKKGPEILMVCSRCGFSHDIRGLQAATESLTLAVVEEIATEDRPDGEPGREDEDSAESVREDGRPSHFEPVT